MKKKAVIGTVLIVVAAGMVTKATLDMLKSKRDIRTARDAVLLSVDGSVPTPLYSFTVNYRDSRGCIVVNAELVTEQSQEHANLRVQHGDVVEVLQYQSGKSARLHCAAHQPITVELTRAFPGRVSFRNNVCGCEIMRAGFFLVASCVIGAILLLVGLLMILKKGTSNPMETNPQ